MNLALSVMEAGLQDATVSGRVLLVSTRMCSLSFIMDSSAWRHLAGLVPLASSGVCFFPRKRKRGESPV